MIRNGACALPGCLLAISLCAVTILAGGFLPETSRDHRRQEFQSLVLGLGFGASVDLSECVYSFDPRMAEGCSQMEGPIPGAFFLCSRHIAGPARSSRSRSPDTARETSDHAPSH